MSEERPTYISCCAGNKVQSDVVVRRFGDLVQLLGYPDMQFTAPDATALAIALNRIATAIKQESAPPP